MTLEGFLATSLAATVAGLIISLVRERMASDKRGAARLRTMLLDVDKMEECASEYVKKDSPKAPAYRLPTDMLHGCLLWFSDGMKLTPAEIRELHELYSDAMEVNRCLDYTHDVASAGGDNRLGMMAQVGRVREKCQNVLVQIPKARAVAKAGIARMWAFEE